MYRHCIFCSHRLGVNETLEAFPIGSRLAFDAWKGRLWAVCPRCRRWNLAPIDERWEAVEAAEKRFRDSRMRVHSENVGLAKLPDGTRLIRVGKALPQEFAAWRYGDELMRRRRRALLWSGAATTVGAAAFGFGLVATAGVLAMYLPMFGALSSAVFNSLGLARHQRSVLARLPREDGAPGALEVIRVENLFAARITRGSGGGIALEIPRLSGVERREENGVVRWVSRPPIVLEEGEAERVLARSLVYANRRGATPAQLGGALDRLSGPEGGEEFLRRVASRGGGLFSAAEVPNAMGKPNPKGAWRRFVGTFKGERISVARPIATRALPREDLLAVEMALHEEAERRALEGELAELEAAWREAEEIASIADILPDDPLRRLGRDDPPGAG